MFCIFLYVLFIFQGHVRVALSSPVKYLEGIFEGGGGESVQEVFVLLKKQKERVLTQFAQT